MYTLKPKVVVVVVVDVVDVVVALWFFYIFLCSVDLVFNFLN